MWDLDGADTETQKEEEQASLKRTCFELIAISGAAVEN